MTTLANYSLPLGIFDLNLSVEYSEPYYRHESPQVESVAIESVDIASGDKSISIKLADLDPQTLKILVDLVEDNFDDGDFFDDIAAAGACDRAYEQDRDAREVQHG